MNQESLKSKFIEWILNTAQVNFPNDEFLSKVLDQKIALVFNTTYNNVPAIDHLTEQELMRDLFLSWKSSSLSFLKVTPGVAINLGTIPVPSDSKKIEHLRNQVLQLEAILGLNTD
ncbi:hypothetical protein [Taibaiella koreensis]|uniref:hypothetical protein n=1 Tax=Taibaiella koreensis TaxID=1268548 RepID=UPI000E59939C|nr:hypothetical protein [Taibaiella koreensis]